MASTHTLGFGNRDPAAVASYCEGTAYLVVGAEPGSVQEVPSWDPADLDNWISRYVASGAPRWRADRVEVDGKHVVVFTIEAPSPEDRICTLQRGFDRTPAGRIFVRRGGKTHEASPAEIVHLEARLLHGQADIEVTLEAEVVSCELNALALPDAAFERWREHEADDLFGSLPAPPPRTAAFSFAASLISFDSRSQDEFRTEVEEYLEHSKQRWLSIAHQKAIDARMAVVQLAIVNRGSRNFPATQVELSLPAGVLAFIEESDPDAVFDRRAGQVHTAVHLASTSTQSQHSPEPRTRSIFGRARAWCGSCRLTCALGAVISHPSCIWASQRSLPDRR